MPEKLDTLKVICPFCNAEYTAKMLACLEDLTEGCSTCGYGAEASIRLDIYCESCERLVYSKEIVAY